MENKSQEYSVTNPTYDKNHLLIGVTLFRYVLTETTGEIRILSPREDEVITRKELLELLAAGKRVIICQYNKKQPGKTDYSFPSPGELHLYYAVSGEQYIQVHLDGREQDNLGLLDQAAVHLT